MYERSHTFGVSRLIFIHAVHLKKKIRIWIRAHIFQAFLKLWNKCNYVHVLIVVQNEKITYILMFRAQWVRDAVCDNSGTCTYQTNQRYISVAVWYFLIFSHVPRGYAELSLFAYLLFAGTVWPFQAQGILRSRYLVGVCVSLHILAWNMIGQMGLKNAGVDCSVCIYAISLSHAAIFGWLFSRGLRDKST
jgi:hypothetical protein